MNIKKKLLEFGSRALRLVLALLIIYASMVFYLVLTERRNAYPRAITHKESREAIASADKYTCATSDGIELEGFGMGDKTKPVVLYYPDADEDVAQFLAETAAAKNTYRIGFNYRGSGNNKGAPDEEKVLQDALQIAACVKSHTELLVDPAPIYVGRGTGAILASHALKQENFKDPVPMILIDPNISIAQRISGKYRALFPKFLVKSKLAIEESAIKNAIVLQDRSTAKISNEEFLKQYPLPNNKREGTTLAEALDKLIQPSEVQTLKD